MGNTCKSMADSFQCMTKPTTIYLKKKDYNSSSVMKQAELNPKGIEEIVAEVVYQLKKEKEKHYSYK